MQKQEEVKSVAKQKKEQVEALENLKHTYQVTEKVYGCEKSTATIGHTDAFDSYFTAIDEAYGLMQGGIAKVLLQQANIVYKENGLQRVYALFQH